MPSTFVAVYNSDIVLESITVYGHAGVKKIGEGYEVCIAISTLTQAMYVSLLSVVGKKNLSLKKSDAFINFELNSFNKLDYNKQNEYKIISNGYLVGIRALIDEYPDFIKYKEELRNGT